MRSAQARSEALPADLRSVSRSHVGRVRQVNEDRVLDRADRGLWAVADGMGGHRGGDIAAELAILALRGLADVDVAVRGEDILTALEGANGEIRARGEAAGGVIGSTIVALQVVDGLAQIFWAGDSRAYRARDGRWEQVTRDHSLVQQLVDQGLIDREQAKRHPRAHVITRALGVEGDVEIEGVSFPVEPGDLLLLCSDGLSRSLGDDAVTEIDEQAAERLLSDALERDGSDNISFVLVGIEG